MYDESSALLTRRRAVGRRRAAQLYNLVYCSRAAAEVDDAAVARIIASARRRNPALGITGLLVFGSGIFFQWLEGPRSQVEQLMALLRTDPRHDDVVTLIGNEEVHERLFPRLRHGARHGRPHPRRAGRHA